jgi:hypothetical protein
MITREIDPSDLDFSIGAMTPAAPVGHIKRAGGFRVVRPTVRGPVVVARVDTLPLARAVSQDGDWVEEVAA